MFSMTDITHYLVLQVVAIRSEYYVVYVRATHLIVDMMMT